MLERIDRYQVRELIGEGSMAEVYRAYDPKLDRFLALKILKQEWCQDEEYLHRFLREARAAGAFSHPNIVAVYDVGQAEVRPYIVMELVDGTPLGEAMTPGEPMPVEQILSIAIQLADALNYAHENGVVHRDVKPSNILLLPDGQTIKITDFGIAHIDDPGAAQQTQVGAILGTPQYMAPEQVMGQKVDGRSDLFSTGVILYLLCTGQRPFEADTMATLLFKITQQDPPDVGSVRPALPVGLQHIIGKLLTKSPERRFQTGEELAAALRHELRMREEQPDDVETHRIIPIRVRWTLAMATLVAATMAVSMYFIENRQSQALTSFAIDSGAAIARIIAAETAIPIVIEDSLAIEVFVDEAVRRHSFHYLTIVDPYGIVQGASDSSLLGQSFVAPEIEEKLYDDGAMRVGIAGRTGGAPILDFATPIKFNELEVGRLHLGLVQTSLQKVVGTTRLLLLALAVVTLVAVCIVSYVLARLLSRPIKALLAGLREIEAGNLDCRISEERRDEFGQVFAQFNKMAKTLDKRNADAIPPS